jgi:hypothetical protein
MYPFLKDASVCPCFCFVHTIAQFSRILRCSHIYSYKDPRLTEMTYHCINFNDRVRQVPYLNFCNFSYEAITQIMDTTATYERIDSGTQREFKSIILEKMRDALSRWTLKKRCQYSILKSCQRKMDRVLKLPLPMSLKNEILGFILSVV